MRWPSEPAKTFGVAAVLIALLALTAAWQLPFALEGQINDDAPIYLDIARHWKEGRGVRLGINFYQDWTGPTIPATPYQHVGYVLWIRAIWAWRDSVAAVSVANVVLAGLSLLLYYALCRRFFSRTVSLVSTALLAFSPQYFRASILPLTEPLQFFLLLAGLLLLWRPRASHPAIAAAGLILAGVMLVRASHLFSYAAVLLGERRRLFFTVSLLALAGWQAFCWARYGKFYPQYYEGARVFMLAARVPGGYYADGEPHLRMPPLGLGFHLREVMVNTPAHLAWFFTRLVLNSGWAMAALPLFLTRLRQPHASRAPISIGTRLFLAQALVPVLGISVSLSWSYLQPRYALLPLAFGLPPLLEGLLGLEWLTDRRVAGAVLGLVLSVGFLQGYWIVRAEPGQAWRLSGIQVPRREAYDHVRAHSHPGDLVASNELNFLYDLDRPAVSLPRGEFMNTQNVEDFLRIFRPSWVVIDRQVVNPNEPWNPIYNRVIEQAGLRLVYSNFGYWVYGRL